MVSRRKWTAVVLTLIFALLLISPSYCAYIPKVDVQAVSDGSAYLTINGFKAVRFVAGSPSAKKRARIMADRLTGALRKGGKPDSLVCKKSGKNARIVIGKSLLLLVTRREAKARKMTAESMATSWTNNIRTFLSMAPLRVEQSSVVVPLGESRSVSFRSLQKLPVNTTVQDSTVIQADSKAGSIVLKGRAVGVTCLSVRCGDVTVAMQASVKKYSACGCREPVKVVLTGSNLAESFISRIVTEAALQGIRLEPGAKVESVTPVSGIPNLHAGDYTDIPMIVRTSGESYLPAKVDVNVKIENRVLPVIETSELMYSNNPERLSKYQLLYVGRVSTDNGSVRLLYHHQNMMGKRIGFVIDVVNAGTSTASIHLIEGVTEPLQDTVIVGYKAGLQFMENYKYYNGQIIDLPTATRRAIVSQPLDAGETASGILELKLLSGYPVMIRVLAKPETSRISEDPSDTEVALDPGIMTSAVASDNIYPHPATLIEAEYTAGGAWTFVRLGKEPLKHAKQKLRLFGNYGVMSDIAFTLKNPDSKPHTAELAFEATAGPASGVFYVNGRLATVRYLDTLGEASLAKVMIPAQGTRAVMLRTMPLSGSAYPATVIVRPAD